VRPPLFVLTLDDPVRGRLTQGAPVVSPLPGCSSGFRQAVLPVVVLIRSRNRIEEIAARFDPARAVVIGAASGMSWRDP
jgi:hypothetical protein